MFSWNQLEFEENSCYNQTQENAQQNTNIKSPIPEDHQRIQEIQEISDINNEEELDNLAEQLENYVENLNNSEPTSVQKASFCNNALYSITLEKSKEYLEAVVKHETKLIQNEKFWKSEKVFNKFLLKCLKLTTTDYEVFKEKAILQKLRLSLIMEGIEYYKNQMNEIQTLLNKFHIIRQNAEYSIISRQYSALNLEIENIRSDCQIIESKDKVLEGLKQILDEKEQDDNVPSVLEAKAKILSIEIEDKEKLLIDNENNNKKFIENALEKLDNLTQTFKSKDENCNHMELQENDFISKIHALKSEKQIDVLKTKIENYEKSLRDKSNRVAIVLQKNASNKNVVTQKKAANINFAAENTDLQKLQEEKQQLLVDVMQNNLNLEKKFAEKKEAVLQKSNSKQFIFHSLESDCEILNEKLKEIQERKIETANKISKYKKLLIEKKLAILIESETLDQNIKETTNFGLEIEAVENKINNVKKQIDNLKSSEENLEINHAIEITEAKNKYDVVKQLKTAKDAVIIEHNNKIKTLQEKKNNLNNEKENLISQVNKINNQIKEIKKRTSILNNKKISIENFLSKVKNIKQTKGKEEVPTETIKKPVSILKSPGMPKSPYTPSKSVRFKRRPSSESFPSTLVDDDGPFDQILKNPKRMMPRTCKKGKFDPRERLSKK